MATHRKHRNHKIQKNTCIQVITLALQQSALQTYFFLLKHRCVMGFSAQHRGRVHSYRNHDSLAFTYKVLTVQSMSEMAGGSENVSSQHYPVSQSGVIISLLMAK